VIYCMFCEEYLLMAQRLFSQFHNVFSLDVMYLVLEIPLVLERRTTFL